MKQGGKGTTSTHVDPTLIEKAVSALLKYHSDKTAGKEDSLLGNDRSIQVQLGLEMAPIQPRKVLRIDIPNPIHLTGNRDDDGLEKPDVCLIVKNESKPWIQELVEENNELMGCIKKVLTLDSLRKKHSRFQQRRELLHKYDIFMADDRILPMLTSSLGKDFIKAKKLPLPIKITRKAALPFAFQKNLSSTYMTLSSGTSIAIRAGNTGMQHEKLVENVVAIAENAGDKVPRKWANVRSIAIKTPESTSLPFYRKLPEELVEIAKLAGIAPTFKTSAEDGNKNSAGTDRIVAKEEEKEDTVSPKRKRDLAAKSPLVRALKKQKQGSKENSEEDKKSPTKGRGSTEVGSSESMKKKSKGAIEETKGELSSKKKRKESIDSVGKESKSAEKKKKRKESEEDRLTGSKENKTAKIKVATDEKKEFVASKKWKGSKKGYVFRRGDQGMGYYVDKKPVVDKMVLQALFRSGSQGKRSKSGGKRRVRR